MATIKDAQRYRKIYSFFRPQPRFEALGSGGGVTEAVINGLDWKHSVRAATTANITLSPAPASVDGYTLLPDDRVLVKDQSVASENGIYAYDSGTGDLVRTVDAVDPALSSAAAVFVEGGVTNADCAFVLVTPDPISVGTTDLSWVKFAGAGSSIFTSSVSPLEAKTIYSVSIDSDNRYASALGGDVFFFVSGSITASSPDDHKALFGGDTVVSGNLVVHNGLDITGDVFEMTGSTYITGSLTVTGSLSIAGDVMETGSMFLSGSLEVTGTMSVMGGLSGSLTNLTDGSSYIVAGTNISVVSSSNGSVTINNTLTPADDFFDSTTASAIFTTGSAAFIGDEAGVDAPTDKGPDVFFYVSGTIGSKDASTLGTSLFGGDVVISGSLYTEGNEVEITGSLAVTGGISGSLTKLSDGSSYIVAGTNITVTSASNGQVTISSTASGISFFSSTTSGSIFTSGSAAFIGDEPGIDAPSDKGGDVFFYVSGAIGARGGATPGVSLFGGDTVVSGAFIVTGDFLEVTGSLAVTNGISGSLTKLADGSSYLVSGTNVTIVSASNGQVTISAVPTSPPSSVQYNNGGIFGGSSNFTYDGTSVYVTGSVAVGQNSKAAGASSFAGGLNSQANGQYSFAHGRSVTATGNWGVSHGDTTNTIGTTSHAEGTNTISYGSNSHAEGAYAHSVGAGSHVEGLFTISSGSYQHAEGQYNLRNNDHSLLVVGNGTGDDDGLRSDIFRVETNSVQVSGSLIQRNSGSSAIGFMGGDVGLPTSKGTDVFFYVSGSSAAGRSDVTLLGGTLVVSGGMVQGNFGVSGNATGKYARAHGERSTASGISAHAEGRFSLAQGSTSHAEGDSTAAYGISSHVEGLDSATYGNYSHAEGRSTEARGAYSHTEGWDANAYADYSHAEGKDTSTIAGATWSHAEGSGSIAIGAASHAEGLCTLASGSNQLAAGQYNLKNNDFSLVVIGNGTSDTVRSDVVRIETNGMQVSGSMTVSGSYSGNANTLSGAGTIGSDGHSMLLTSTGIGNAVTLSNGTWTGQLKYVVGVSGYTAGNTTVITPTNALGYTTVTFDSDGDATTFFWTGSKWVVVGYYGAAII